MGWVGGVLQFSEGIGDAAEISTTLGTTPTTLAVRSLRVLIESEATSHYAIESIRRKFLHLTCKRDWSRRRSRNKKVCWDRNFPPRSSDYLIKNEVPRRTI
jgi:hypothetical protein